MHVWVLESAENSKFRTLPENSPVKSLRKNRENFEKFPRNFREIFLENFNGQLREVEFRGQFLAFLTIP